MRCLADRLVGHFLAHSPERHHLGFGHQEAPQAHGEEEAPQAAEAHADPASQGWQVVFCHVPRHPGPGVSRDLGGRFARALASGDHTVIGFDAVFRLVTSVGFGSCGDLRSPSFHGSEPAPVDTLVH